MSASIKNGEQKPRRGSSGALTLTLTEKCCTAVSFLRKDIMQQVPRLIVRLNYIIYKFSLQYIVEINFKM